MESNQSLRRLIDFSPDSDVAEAAHRIVRSVRAALILLHHRNPVGIVAVGSHAGRIVDRKLQIITEFRTGKPLR